MLKDMDIGISAYKTSQYPGDMYVVEYPNGYKDQFRPEELVNFLDSIRAGYNQGFRDGEQV
jgi:hypothetical protein